ncbi:MAG: copper chaperone PCu(A)C [Paracoccaceae bacterium]|nr:copper chaperone PCu(A)C [Paracoccaceae bacterium]
MSFIRVVTVSLALALPFTAPLAAQADSSMQMGAMIQLGPLELSNGFSRATLPHAPVGGGFLTIKNTGSTADRLIGASSAVAGHVEVHEMKMVGDVMKMSQLRDGLPIPAGATVTLRPGGFHLMFMDLKQPLVQGKTVTVTLTFEHAGKVEMPLMIGAPNAGAKGAMAPAVGPALVPGAGTMPGDAPRPEAG